jgi:Ni/Co efflux regulator RcnB
MKKLLTAALAVSVLATAGMANAQGMGQGPQRPDSHQNQGPQNQGHQNQGPDRHDDNGRGPAPKRYQANRYQPPRGYQESHQWRRGEKLPSSYRSKSYVVDYRHYGLKAPPRGYQYVRVGNDVVLTAIATGLISSVIVQLFQ